MIIKTVNFQDFQDAFNSIRPNNFSYEGSKVLFNHLEQLSDDMGEPLELDVIALCCDFTEAPLVEVLKDNNLDTLNELHDMTIVLDVNSETIIYGAF